MLHLNINKLKSLVFEAQIGSIQPNQLKGSLKLIINNVEYGFPVTFKNESIIVDIPPLKNVINANFKDGDIIESKLEANGDGFYMEPWSGKFIIKNPVMIEATIKEDINYDSNIDKDLISESSPINKDSNNIKENKEETYEELLKNKVSKKLKSISNLINSTKSKKKVKESGKETLTKTITKDIIESNTKTITKTNTENITKEYIFEFMTSVGTRNEQIQEMVYDQSLAEAKSADPKKVFEKVREMLKK